MVLGGVKGKLAANDQEVEARFAHVLQIENGQVARLKVCLDRDAALKELG
jgi:ketosteroid isomerase-like protein